MSKTLPDFCCVGRRRSGRAEAASDRALPAGTPGSSVAGTARRRRRWSPARRPGCCRIRRRCGARRTPAGWRADWPGAEQRPTGTGGGRGVRHVILGDLDLFQDVREIGRGDRESLDPPAPRPRPPAPSDQPSVSRSLGRPLPLGISWSFSLRPPWDDGPWSRTARRERVCEVTKQRPGASPPGGGLTVRSVRRRRQRFVKSHESAWSPGVGRRARRLVRPMTRHPPY